MKSENKANPKGKNNPHAKENTPPKDTSQTKEIKSPKKPRNRKKIIKWAAVLCIIIAVIVAAAILLPKFFEKKETTARVVTYNVEEITYGSVSTKVSGSGNLTPLTQKTISAEYPCTVNSVALKSGEEVAKDTVIASVTYTKTERTAGDPIKQTAETVTETTEEADITAPFDGIIIELPVSEGDEVTQGGEICMIMGKDGFTMGISVDELNISNFKMGQDVKYTIDAVSGSFTGKITSISYNGSTNGSATSYKVQASLDYTEGIYPGMSASAQIVTEESGEGMLVPVDAVNTSGDTSYILLAPSDAETGKEYNEDEIDTSKLTKVTVTTGVSDGSYILIEGDSISKGDRIIIKKITSTATGSDSDSRSGSRGGMSFPGGSFPGGGNFDFSNFDPSNRPSRGSGGNFPSFGN